jgi:hypothetical protein
MASLAHQSLYALVKSGATIDRDDPIIRDQLFSVQMTRTSHLQRIRKLRSKIGKTKTKAHEYSNFRNLPKVNYYMIDTACSDLSTELFDRFTWASIVTPSQAAWKEYFHSVYDLIVPDSNDHIGKLIMMHATLKYHDIIPPPNDPIDPKDTCIHTIKRLLENFKREQVSACKMMGDFDFQIKETVRHATAIQVDIIRMNRELKILSDEVHMFSEILEVH